METAYGDRTARPPADDVIAWLAWCQTQTALRRWGNVAGCETADDARH